MQTYSITEAKAHLSELVERVMDGESILLTKMGKPAAQIVPFANEMGSSWLGMFAGQIEIPDDFDEWPDDMKALLGMED